MDTERLHRLAEEADAEHRAAMGTSHQDLAVRVFGASGEVRASRRRFVRRLGLGTGAVLVSVPVLARMAAAQDTSTATTLQAGNAGPEPPNAPTTEDKVLLGWAQSLELALADAYAAAVGTGKLTAEVTPVAEVFGEHHREHAQAHAALAAKAALNTANGSALAEIQPRIEAANNQTELLQVVYEFELTAAATYVAALGELVGSDASELVGSILPTESRHAAVWADALALPPAEGTPALIEASDGLVPADYPVIAG